MKAASEGDKHTYTKQQANEANKITKTSKIKDQRGQTRKKTELNDQRSRSIDKGTKYQMKRIKRGRKQSFLLLIKYSQIEVYNTLTE